MVVNTLLLTMNGRPLAFLALDLSSKKQNLDSSEISLTDVSHYYDSDPTKVVQGLRDDGKKPSSFMADTTTANAQVNSLLVM